MQIKSRHILYAVVILTLLLILIISVFPGSVIRIILGLPLILFFPGYTLMSALFPRESAIGRLDKIALSFGVSIAVVSLIGLAVSFTPWGIGLYSILVSISAFILVLSIVAWFRQLHLPDKDRPTITLSIKRASFSGLNRLDKILTVVLAVAIVAAIGVLTFVVTSPRTGDKFTEFYILGMSGKAADYPSQLSVGGNGEVIVGVVNHEQKSMSYSLEVRVEGVLSGEPQQLNLAGEEKWEKTVSFTPARAGDGQKVEFLLLVPDKTEPYQDLHLWIDVKP
jgi:uncharacterized membrane protein